MFQASREGSRAEDTGKVIKALCVGLDGEDYEGSEYVVNPTLSLSPLAHPPLGSTTERKWGAGRGWGSSIIIKTECR